MQVVRFRAQWFYVLSITVITVFIYFLFEWLFHITKDSFMSWMGFFDQASILIKSATPIYVITCFFVFFLWFYSLLFDSKMYKHVCIALARLIPATIIAFLIFMLIDNFTFTMFRFGSNRSADIVRIFYLLFLIFLFGVGYRIVWRFELILVKARKANYLNIITIFICTISILLIVFTTQFSLIDIDTRVSEPTDTNRPNILIFTSDGLTADNLSIYGYKKNTTPFMKSIKDEFLIAKNAFNNTSTSHGSVASMLTGKHPLETRVYTLPDILKGKDSYEHFPAILKTLGYYNFDVGVKIYTDPYEMNMRGAFDISNGRINSDNDIPTIIDELIGVDSSYFIYIMKRRLLDRLLHVFGIAESKDYYGEVEYDKDLNDKERMIELYKYIDNSKKPFFGHVHLIDTHSTKKFLQKGENHNEKSAEDFYNDAILEFDKLVKNVYDYLKNKRILEETIFIITTDHPTRLHDITERIPLIIRFPKRQRSRIVIKNVQLLDLTVTILDYLNVEEPEWMSGESILSDKLDEYRKIYQCGAVPKLTITGEKRKEIWKKISTMRDIQKYTANFKPPFYNLRKVSVIMCNKKYTLNLETGEFIKRKIKGYKNICKDRKRLKKEEEKILDAIIERLSESGYNVRILIEEK